MVLKVLFCATYPDQPIGYGNIAHKISNYLAQDEFIDFYYFGFSNAPNSRVDRFIHPRIKFIDVIQEEIKINSKLIFGTEIIENTMDEIKPDILFIYNDAIVIYRLLHRLQEFKKNNPFKTILYIDLVYPFENYQILSFIKDNSDFIFTFTEYWKNNLIDMGFDPNKLSVFHHGLNQDLKKVDKLDARKSLNLNQEDFIVLNTNRNSYRKALDITISAFLKFFKINDCNNKLKLFLNCYLNVDSGYNLLEVIRNECFKLKLNFEEIILNQILIMGDNTGQISDEKINLLYNACDLGINTCVGEGFGLCNMEHAALGRPQIISAVGGLIDIFKNTPAKLIKPVATLAVTTHQDCHNGDLHICNSDDFVDQLNYYFHNQDKIIKDGETLKKHIKENFKWDILLENFKIEFLKKSLDLF